MLKKVLKKTIEGNTLTIEEAKDAMDQMMNGVATASQIASLLTILRFRGETVEEMTGFVQSMRKHVISIPHDMEVMDTCGTGGDGASTFNISTATAILLSAVGIKVAKHGNHAMSSQSGSSDVLEYLGIPIETNISEAQMALKAKNMCFLHAPFYHISMKHAAPTRKEIGFRTIFNLLGPLTNPANSEHQLLGVFDTQIAEKMAKTLRELGAKRAVFVTGGEGLDECSIATHTDMVILDGGEIRRAIITPEDVGLERGSLQDIQVSSAKESGEMILAVLTGEGNRSATGTLLLNAGAGLYAAGVVETIAEGVHQAKKAIQDGHAYDQLNFLRNSKRVKSHA